jgi:uncharacterized membrane protein YvbJ
MTKCEKCGSKSNQYGLGDSYQTCMNCGEKQEKDKTSLAWEARMQAMIARIYANDDGIARIYANDDGNEK